ncbi:MAG: prolyl oligopeptidase family serine peptidase, partial [Ilumatobacteraceae bacterium]
PTGTSAGDGGPDEPMPVEPVPVEFGPVSIDALGVDPIDGTAVVVTSGFTAPGALRSVGPDGGIATIRGGDGVIEPGAAGLPDLTVDEVAYASTDGVEVGMFLVRSSAGQARRRPTVLTGYGGFAITMSPAWSPMIAAWCEAGGQYVIAGLRGGSEHGEAWHRAGQREHKQQVFDDFCAAADWLVDTGRTDRAGLAIAGGSNGGLLVGAALTQRPDLCRAVWCAVPLLDMVRFPQFLIARLWTDEFGDPDMAEEFAWLHAYSPYHRVVDGTCYPAVLLTTAEGDTRVDPLHARKMAARLQAASSCLDERPVLLHQEGHAGHGQGKPVAKRVAEQADVLAFFTWHLVPGGKVGA